MNSYEKKQSFLKMRYNDFLIKFKDALVKIGYPITEACKIVKSFDDTVLFFNKDCDVFNIKTVYGVINCASIFNWKKTKEGADFWYKIEEELFKANL